jgi:zinc transport system permease protein
MAIGIIFINLTPGYVPDLLTYLFGSILTVPPSDLMIMFILDLIIIATVLIFRREFLSICFDDEFSKVIGMHTTLIYLLLLSLVALSVVVLIKVVGVILVIALLTIPAAIAKQYTFNLKMMMILSIGMGMLLTVAGLYFSYLFNLASGATIVLVLGLAFLLSTFYKKFTSNPSI